jgi:8-oxo-dGTP diphosphatase
MPHYDYPRPMLTVDIFLLRLHLDHFEVLLIQRKNDPFKDKWALPGGYVEIDELIEAAAKRELYEETGIESIPLCKLDVFGDPGRDPRGRTITVVYFGAIPPEFERAAKAGDDAAQSQWYSLSHLPELAFDHDRIIEVCSGKFKSNLLLRFWFLLFANKEFSVDEINRIANIMEYELPDDKIEAILFKLPFVKQKKRNEFKKEITTAGLLRLSDADVAAIWGRI